MTGESATGKRPPSRTPNKIRDAERQAAQSVKSGTLDTLPACRASDSDTGPVALPAPRGPERDGGEDEPKGGRLKRRTVNLNTSCRGTVGGRRSRKTGGSNLNSAQSTPHAVTHWQWAAWPRGPVGETP